MSGGIARLDQRELERTLRSLFHGRGRDDVHVSVTLLVNFKVTEENYVNTIVDPWQHFPRAKAQQMVDAVIEKLKEQADEIEMANEAKEPDNVFTNAKAEVETGETSETLKDVSSLPGPDEGEANG